MTEHTEGMVLEFKKPFWAETLEKKRTRLKEGKYLVVRRYLDFPYDQMVEMLHIIPLIYAGDVQELLKYEYRYGSYENKHEVLEEKYTKVIETKYCREIKRFGNTYIAINEPYVKCDECSFGKHQKRCKAMADLCKASLGNVHRRVYGTRFEKIG